MTICGGDRQRRSTTAKLLSLSASSADCPNQLFSGALASGLSVISANEIVRAPRVCQNAQAVPLEDRLQNRLRRQSARANASVMSQVMSTGWVGGNSAAAGSIDLGS
jgi:hypothetical protein